MELCENENEQVMMRSADNQGRAAGKTVSAGFGYGFATRQNPSWNLNEILLATGGRLASGGSPASFHSISTDSRTVMAGDIFLALAGDNYDGAHFVDDALKKGAAGIIVPINMPELSVPVIVVPDTLVALGDLAAYRRAKLRNMKVLAVTGSSGKTTVKDMVASILSGCGRVIKTQKNFNNLIGLPLSLLPASYCHDFAVLEMGMNAPGEIGRLTEIADPEIACINNVHPAHLAGLGDVKGVATAKGELFSNCRGSSIFVANIDDPLVRCLVRKCKNKLITFGRRRGANVRATYIHNCGASGSSFTLHLDGEKTRVHLNALGEHNILNSLAAAAMAWAAGANIGQIARGLAKFTSADKRLQIIDLKNGLRVVDDSYNANPASMQVALTAVQKLGKGEKYIAILGDMLELGNFSMEAHSKVGGVVACLGVDYLLAVGDYAKTMVAAAREAGMRSKRAMSFASKEDLVVFLQKLLAGKRISSGDLLLVKGSRGMKMEEVIDQLGRL